MTTSDSPWLTADQQDVWRRWLRVTSLLPVALHDQLQADSDLSFPDFEVLTDLSEAEGHRLRVGELARSLQWERSRVSHHVRRMETRGLVRREDCADDARGAFVALTPGGLDAVERAAPGHARTVRRLMFEPLAARELGQLSRILARIEDALATDV